MINNKVLLINSNLMKPPVAPIGLDYIGSILISNSFNVEFLDLNFSDNIKYDIRKKLTNNSFLAIGLNIRNTDDCYYLSQDFFLPKIKEIVAVIKKYSDSPIILGGGGFSVAPLEITKYLKADYGIIGDGEITFLKLLENIKNNTNFFKPVFYISEEIGKDIVEYTYNLVYGDKRFFMGATEKEETNYNYNENLRLQEAIKNGYRGAFWDILEQINF